MSLTWKGQTSVSALSPRRRRRGRLKQAYPKWLVAYLAGGTGRLISWMLGRPLITDFTCCQTSSN